MSSSKETTASKEDLSTELAAFIHNIDALRYSFPTTTTIVSSFSIACAKNLQDFVQKHCKPTSTDNDNTTYTIDQDSYLEFARLRALLGKAKAADLILPQSFIVSLVSQFDAFSGGLLRFIFRNRPHFLKKSKLGMTYEQLSDFATLENLKSHILEKKVENFLRMSHPSQFAWLGNKFDTTFTDLPSWPKFVELTQRRNLFVHCSGKVSAQYLKVCDEHKVNYDSKPKPNEILGVTPKYFLDAHSCVFEIGTKLAHVLWRKVSPGDRESADSNLLGITYDLLKSERFEQAICIGEFAYTQKSHSSTKMKMQMAINLAQAYKWHGDDAKASKILKEIDWSACAPMFRLATSVLNDDPVAAALTMKEIGENGDIKVNDYRDWPLFKQFRDTTEFKQSFKEIFGQDFQPLEPSPLDILFSATSWQLLEPKDKVKPKPEDETAPKSLSQSN